jgi:hypothetical protein
VQHPRPKTITTLALSLGALTGLALAQPAPTGVTPSSIRRSTAGSSNIGEFPEDSGVAAPPTAPRGRGEVGGTGTVDRERGPQGQLRGSTGAAPGEIDYSRPISAADVARLLRTQEPRLRTCYDAARATHPRLAGRVSLRLVVSRTGELTNVEVAGFPDAPAVAPCMAAELRQVRFPRPESGVLPFNYAMNFAPPAAPPPRTARSRPRPR